MLFSNITILDENLDIKKNMYVGTEGEMIEYIGDTVPDKDYGEVYDGEGKLLMPSFVNAHAHSPMSLMRGYGENLSLMDWLTKRIFPFEDQLDSDAVYWATLLSMAESIRYGITSTTDMYYFCEDMARAVIDSGAKANISRSVVGPMEGSDFYAQTPIKEMLHFYENFNEAENGRIKVDSSLHAEYTSDPEIVYQLADLTRNLGINMHVHVSETSSEHESCKKKYGLTPVEYFLKHGLFDTPTTAAHCVWLEGDDYDILKEKSVTVAVNPVSNLKLASGVCNISELFNHNINVAIGTDSSASNNNLNFLEEMKLFALLPKERMKNPSLITPSEVINAATFAGARSQGRWDSGKLAEGYRADLLVIDLSVPNMHAVHDIKSNVVYSATPADIILTMADGKVLYRDGEYLSIDIERVIFEADRCTGRILKKLDTKAIIPV